MNTPTPLAPGTLIDCPSALPEPRPPLMKRMCASCELVLGWVVCGAEQAGAITHTSCQACFDRDMAALADYLANRAAHALADEYSLDLGAARSPAPLTHRCMPTATTESAPRCAATLTVDELAALTCLTRATIYQTASAAGLGAPAHFRYEEGVTTYTLLGLCQLANELDKMGLTTAAKCLAAWIAVQRQSAATATRVTSPDELGAVARRWDLKHERAQEEAA